MIPDRLSRLRSLMRADGLSAYYVPSEDFHLSEYTGAYFKARSYLSGFTGSAGTLLVTLDWAGLWTDGRYFLMAAEQLQGSGIELMRMGEPGVPAITDFLKDTLKQGAVVGMDGRTLSASEGKRMEKALSAKCIAIEPRHDLVGKLWDDRPPLMAEPAFVLDERYAGESAASKLKRVRGEMLKKGADLHVLSSLDDIAWLYNIRGGDVKHCPVVLAYTAIGRDYAHLFVDGGKLPPDVAEHLASIGVDVLPYDAVYDFARSLGEGVCTLVSMDRINYALYDILTGHSIVIDSENPTLMMKAIKNAVEIENLRRAYIKDGVVMVRFIKWLKEGVAKGDRITELQAAQRLDAMRRATEGNLGLSFDTISAYGPHGAMPHYSVDAADDVATIEPRGLYVVDSGGQYYEGTTDITRTLAMGPLTDDEKLHFALTLESMFNLSSARFLYGCRGVNLDILAREPFWSRGLDFKHGTGHGIGYLLSVHEPPNGFRWRIVPERNDACVLEAGMVTSDEPGVYIEGSHGVRTENAIVCMAAEQNAYGKFLYFETLTFVPIDLDAVDRNLLNDVDIARLNGYHAMVYAKLSPHLNDEERAWLMANTRAI